jgi:capsular polysaccharide biosynthesis protein
MEIYTRGEQKHLQGEHMEQTLDLMQYWDMIRKRWAIVVIIPCIAIVTSLILNFVVIEPVYQATAMVIVGKRAENQADKQVEYNSVLANQQLAKTYETIAKSRTVLERVKAQIGGGISGEVNVQAVKGTEIIAVSVTDKDPKRAALIANKLTEEFANRVKEIKKVDSVGIIDEAVAPGSPITPKKASNAVLALILGLFVSLGLVFLLEVFDNTLKKPAEIEKLTGLTVLGSIPEF